MPSVLTATVGHHGHIFLVSMHLSGSKFRSAAVGEDAPTQEVLFEMEDGNEFFSFLNTNRDVLAFCRIINRRQSLLEDIEIELQGYEYEPLRALTRLLRSCRGRLVLKLVRLPAESCAHIVPGKGLRKHCCDLRELRFRFLLCHLQTKTMRTLSCAPVESDPPCLGMRLRGRS